MHETFVLFRKLNFITARRGLANIFDLRKSFFLNAKMRPKKLEILIDFPFLCSKDFFGLCLIRIKRTFVSIKDQNKKTFIAQKCKRIKIWQWLYVAGQLIERHLIESTLNRIIKEKIYNFESVSILSIFCPRNIVVFKKRTSPGIFPNFLDFFSQKHSNL